MRTEKRISAAAFAVVAAFSLGGCGSKSATTDRDDAPANGGLNNSENPGDGSADGGKGSGDAGNPGGSGSADSGNGGTLVFPANTGVTAKANAYIVNVEWRKGPIVDPDNQATLVFATANRQSVASVDGVTISPFMPAMGHGAPVRHLGIARNAVRTFAYDVTGLYFIMSGTWDLTVTATVDGVKDVAVVTVDVP